MWNSISILYLKPNLHLFFRLSTQKPFVKVLSLNTEHCRWSVKTSKWKYYSISEWGKQQKQYLRNEKCVFFVFSTRSCNHREFFFLKLDSKKRKKRFKPFSQLPILMPHTHGTHTRVLKQYRRKATTTTTKSFNIKYLRN